MVVIPQILIKTVNVAKVAQVKSLKSLLNKHLHQMLQLLLIIWKINKKLRVHQKLKLYYLKK